MAYIPRSSFIPKEASGGIPMQVKRRRTVHVFGLIATIMLSVSILGSVGIFFYNDYLDKQLEVVKTELGKKGSDDNQQKIAEIKAYDHKLMVARNLLDNHLALSSVFEELQNSTKETVRFTSFEFVYEPGFEATLTLGADTKELASVVLQEMQFSEDGLFSDFLIQGVELTSETSESGTEGGVPEKKVGFNVTGILKQGLLKYTGEIASAEDTNTTDETLDLFEEVNVATTTTEEVSPATIGSETQLSI